MVTVRVLRVGVVDPKVPVQQHRHQLGCRHGGGGMAGAGGGAGPDRVDPQLFRELVAEVALGGGRLWRAADVFGNSHSDSFSVATSDS